LSKISKRELTGRFMACKLFFENKA